MTKLPGLDAYDNMTYNTDEDELGEPYVFLETEGPEPVDRVWGDVAEHFGYTVGAIVDTRNGQILSQDAPLARALPEFDGTNVHTCEFHLYGNKYRVVVSALTLSAADDTLTQILDEMGAHA